MKIVLRTPRVTALFPELSTGAIAVSVGFHLFLGAGLVVLAGRQSPPPPTERIYTVSLVSDPQPGAGGGCDCCRREDRQLPHR